MNSKFSYVMDNFKIKGLLEKFAFVEQKTSEGVAKAVSIIVHKLLQDKSGEAVPEEIKKEIVQKLTNYDKGRNLIPILGYVNKTILTNMPKNLSSVKSFKKNVMRTLVKDAKKRLEKNKRN